MLHHQKRVWGWLQPLLGIKGDVLSEPLVWQKKVRPTDIWRMVEGEVLLQNNGAVIRYGVVSDDDKLASTLSFDGT